MCSKYVTTLHVIEHYKEEVKKIARSEKFIDVFSELDITIKYHLENALLLSEIFQDEHFQIIHMIFETDFCLYYIIKSSVCFLMLPSGKAFQLSHNNQPLSPTCYSKT